MSHLSIETLARLIEEAPTAEEAAHLESCNDCRAELEGLKADAAALAGLSEIQPPSAQWLAIESRLAAEGLLRPAARRAANRWFRPLLQVAAAIVIFVIGNYSATLVALRSAPEASVASAPGIISTPDAAASAVREAEASYLAALTRYAELAQRSESVDPLARLAALESIVLTTRAALGQAPADPVINGYHLTALAQRDATIKRLSSTPSTGQTWF